MLKKIVSLSISILVIAFSFFACSGNDLPEPSNSAAPSSPAQSDEPSPSQSAPPENSVSPEAQPYKYELDYHKASDYLKNVVGDKILTQAYKIVDAFFAHEDSVTLDIQYLPNNFADKLGYAASLLCPQFAAFNNYNSMKDLNLKTGKFTFRYVVDKEEIDKKTAELEKKVSEIMSDLCEGDSNTMRALIIYNDLTRNASYDNDLPKNVKEDDTNFIYVTSAYSAILDGLGICTSYARALSFLYTQADIDAGVVSSSVGEQHEWTIAKLNDKYYYFDPTWDLGGYIKYFGITSADRAALWAGEYPENSCTAYEIVVPEKYNITDERFSELRNYGSDVSAKFEADRTACVVHVPTSYNTFDIDCK